MSFEPKKVLPLLAMIGAFSIGHTCFVLQPLLLGVFVEYRGVNEASAGYIAATEMLGVALASIAILRWIPELDRRRLAWLGLTLYVTANLLTIIVSDFNWILVARLLVGVGAGFVLAAYKAAIASAEQPERLFASVMFIGVMHTAFLLWLFPILVEWGGISAMMLGQVVNALIFASLMVWLPRYRQGYGGGRTSLENNDYSGSSNTKSSVILVLCAVLLLYMGHGAIWAYQERIGNSVGLDGKTIGTILASASLIGSVGAAAAAFIGLRLGRTLPNVFALVPLILAALFLPYIQSMAVFSIWAHLIKIAWFFGLPFLIGLSAVLDRSGQSTVLMGIVIPMGAALGTSFAALLVGGFGYSSIGWLTASCYLACLLLALFVAYSLDQKERVLIN